MMTLEEFKQQKQEGGVSFIETFGKDNSANLKKNKRSLNKQMKDINKVVEKIKKGRNQ